MSYVNDNVVRNQLCNNSIRKQRHSCKFIDIKMCPHVEPAMAIDCDVIDVCGSRGSGGAISHVTARVRRRRAAKWRLKAKMALSNLADVFFGILPLSGMKGASKQVQ